MPENYIFSELSEAEVLKYRQQAKVFSIDKESLGQEELIENKFITEDLGGSAEKVDIFLNIDNEFKNISEFLNTSLFFANLKNELGEVSSSGTYLLGGMLAILDEKKIDYKGVLIITRIMSNFLLDKDSSSLHVSYFHLCDKELYEFLLQNPMLEGWLVKNNILLGKDYKNELYSLIQKAYETKELSLYNYDLYTKSLGGDVDDARTKNSNND